MIYLRAKNTKSRKPDTAASRRRSIISASSPSNKEPRFAEYMFHNAGEPVGASARHGQRPVLLRDSAR